MIKLFAAFYNEAPLIPFFLSHYHWVQTIHAIVTPSQDGTRALLAADARVQITDVAMPDGIDDEAKVQSINEALRQPDYVHAWHLVADADEFFWPPDDPSCSSALEYLSTVPRHAVAFYGWLFQVYRHVTDADLDLAQTPVVCQRRHGYLFGNKPSFLRPNHGLQLTPGNHRFVGDQPVSETHRFDGAHWQNADPSFAAIRRVRDRAERISAVNRLHHHGTHHWADTMASVHEELTEHAQDARVF